MHDGCNARAWVQIQVNADSGPLLKGTRIFHTHRWATGDFTGPARILGQAQAGFEAMHEVPMLFEAHNEMNFYTWTEQRCCLPKAATSAELDGHFPDLQKGDVLIFEEVLGPRTGPARRRRPSAPSGLCGLPSNLCLKWIRLTPKKFTRNRMGR